MKKCNSCGNMVEDKDGMELTDGRFFCKSGGCQERFLIGIYESEVKPGLMRQGGVVIRSTSNPLNSSSSVESQPANKTMRRKWWQFWK